MNAGLSRIAAMVLCVAFAGLPALAAESEKAAEYVCPMRGRPCPETNFTAPGKCPVCTMALVTRAAYDAQEATMKHIGVVLYTGFELLDVAGPMEMWGNVPTFRLHTVAEKAGPVGSIQGAKIIADHGFDDCPKLDILMVPGGMGTLTELNKQPLLDFLKARSVAAELTTSVCSGSALLAKAGVLDGHKATSNKLYFGLATMQSDKVEWIRKARWVDDGKVVTSSGVSAGIDMALHVIARYFGDDQAEKIARMTEYVWHKDPGDDPFASPGK